MAIIYKPNEIIYLRRYLNDVGTEILGDYTAQSAPIIYKLDEITYLRRYLNDLV